ncbi:MAG: PucR family transcriptional regulator ligand-binding domain-containing protein [Rectinema sp.]
MAVTVRQIMKSEIMGKARIVAGESGLDRVIRRVSFIDSPFTAEVLNEPGILMPGDFFISSFFVVKDNPDQMMEMLKLLLASESSGLCVISKLFSELPQVLIRFADEHNYPIVFINQDYPYGDMIRDILMLIVQDKEGMLIEMKLNDIVGLGKDEDKKVEEKMLKINNHFAKYVVAVYCRSFDLEDITTLVFLKNRINVIKEWLCVKFRDNILIILTFGRSDQDNINTKLKYVFNQLKQVSKRYMAGISTVGDLGKANRVIMEAMIASELKPRHDQDTVCYRDIGSYKFLLPLKDQPELLEFHDEIILPILEYDEKYKQNLMKTAVCFVDNDGDFSKTAEKMYLHENSVRYRLNKIMEILNFQDKNMAFYEQLFIAVKLHRILKGFEGDQTS